jgi:RHS repeat-associated protein
MNTNLFLGFTGARRDPVSAGYPLGNGYRTYLPGLMRFIAPDSLSPFGQGGVNPYAYCVDDPINRSDPSGHVGIGTFFKSVGQAISRRFTEGSDTEPLLDDAASIARRESEEARPATPPSPQTGPVRRVRRSDDGEGAAVDMTEPTDNPLYVVKNDNYKRIYEITLGSGALPSQYSELSILGDSSGGNSYRMYDKPLTLNLGETRKTFAIDGGAIRENTNAQWLLARIRSPFPSHNVDRLLTIRLEERDVMGGAGEVLHTEYSAYGGDKATVSARFGSPLQRGDRMLVPVDIDEISFGTTRRKPWYEQ